MILFKHRANQLTDPDKYWALEIDVKSDTKHLVVGHDSTENVCSLHTYLSRCTENTILAINVKQTGIVTEILKLVKESSVPEFFLFDLVFPDTLELSAVAPEHLAVRVSEYETLDIYKNLNYEWIWLDIFQHHDRFDYNECKFTHLISNKKVVVVSPELHGSSYRYNNLTHDAYGLCTDDL